MESQKMYNENTIFTNPNVSLEAKGLLALVLALLDDRRVNWIELTTLAGKNSETLKEITGELKKNAIDIWSIRARMNSTPKSRARDAHARDAHARITTAFILSFFNRDYYIKEINNNCCNNNACAREKTAFDYPATSEEVILAASDRNYIMSIAEAANFLAAYAATDWTLKDGRKITNWRMMLDRWKVYQNPDQKRAAVEEWQERHAGRDPYKLISYEYYTDDQGRKWRRPFGNDSAEWEGVTEYFIGDDGEPYPKSVM